MGYVNDKVKATIVMKEDNSSCTMKNCRHREAAENEPVPYLKFEASFPHIDEVGDHQALLPGMGIVRQFEVNMREKFGVSEPVIGQLVKGDAVKILEKSGDWLHVEYQGFSRWIIADAIETYEQREQRERLKGETHEVLVCVTCLATMDWDTFYKAETENHQQGHVLSNYILDYAAFAIAHEYGSSLDEDNHSENLSEMLSKEIDSGEHGSPSRFSKEKILKSVMTQRA